MPLSFSNPVGQRAQVAISSAQRKVTRSGEAMGTGKKNPVTDITGYILGSRLDSNAKVLGAISGDAKYGINLLQVAFSGLQSIEQNLEKQLEIIAKAGTPGAGALAQLQATFDGLKTASNRIATNTRFDDKNVLDGTLTAGNALTIRLGITFADNVTVSIADTKVAAIYVDNLNNAVAAPDIVTDNASRAIADQVINNALNTVRTRIAAVGSMITNLELATETIDESRIVQQDGADGYLGTNYEEEIDNYTENLNKIQASIATIIKSAALSQSVLQLIQNA